MATSVRRRSSFDPLMNTSRSATSMRCAKLVAAVAAAVEPHPLAGGGGESLHHLRCDRLMRRTVEHGLRPLGIGLGLVTDRAQALDAVFQRRVVEIGDARLYGSLAASPALFDVRDQRRLALRLQRHVDRGSARQSGDALAEGALRPFGQAADRVRAILRRCRPHVEIARALR